MKNLQKIILSAFVIFGLACLVSCDDGSSTELFNDHVIQVWAESLEPFSYDIAFYGDSRVIGADWVSEFDDYSVVNLGIGGDVVSGLIRRLPLLKAADVKYCFVAIGGNDCFSSKFDISVFKKQYEKLLDELNSMGLTVFVCTIAGITGEGNDLSGNLVERGNRNIAQANEVIKQLCEAKSIYLLDMAELMNKPDGSLKTEYSSDGVHFTALGNRLWFDTVRLVIEDNIPNSYKLQ